MIEKALIVFCLIAGSILTFITGSVILDYMGLIDLAEYTAGLLIAGAGIRAVLKG